MTVYNPIYLDGPLANQEFKVTSQHVRARDFGSGEHDFLTFPLSGEEVEYVIKELAFQLNGRVTIFHVAACHGQPNVEDVIRAIVKPELIDRFAFHRSVVK